MQRWEISRIGGEDDQRKLQQSFVSILEDEIQTNGIYVYMHMQFRNEWKGYTSIEVIRSNKYLYQFSCLKVALIKHPSL